ncbi:MAG: methyl-accepting chemotaxis protein [Methylobacter sp.]|nr:methyl-accepting chemotaxis protein [Methylobacter sp.]
MSRMPFKRSHIFINKAIQVRFIAGALLMILLSGLCSALLIFWITGGDLQAQSQSAHANIANSWERLGLSILISNAVAMIIAGTLAWYWVLHATHKIVGPLYRFEKNCEHIGEGNFDDYVSLRETDQLQALGLAFTHMVDKLRTKKSEQQDVVARINAQVEQLKLDQGMTGHQLGELNELARLVKQL